MKPSAPSIILPRRSFLRKIGCTGMSTWALSSTIRDLRLMNSALAADNVSGYKALVCLFLAGGNDANNWIVPTDSETFAAYTAIRDNLALPQSSLLSLRTGINQSDPLYTDAAGHTYGFHPSCAKYVNSVPQDGIWRLFNEGKLATVFNVGTLVRPTTRAQYTSSNAAFYKPPQLFSHNDQVTQWQTSIPDAAPTTGWGGRLADLLNPAANSGGQISMSVSLNGANTFEVGNIVSQYHVSTSGAISLSSGLTNPRLRALTNIVGLSHANLQRTAFADVTKSAIKSADILNNSIAATAEAPAGSWVWNTPFPTSSLGQQMKMIARVIQARGPAAFNMKRQVFFCSAGGFDTHTSQVAAQVGGQTVDAPENAGGAHYKLLNDISECMFAFQRAMEQLGVANDVTTFTASDFSRTLPTNSQGSDHGWGSHHMVMGGAVKGRQTYGKLPTFAVNGPDDTGLGRWIPTLAVDQYSATLAKWFGVDPGGNMDLIFPNLVRFGTRDLGFML